MHALPLLLSKYADHVKNKTFMQFCQDHLGQYLRDSGGVPLTRDAYRHARRKALASSGGVESPAPVETSIKAADLDLVSEVDGRVRTLDELIVQAEVDLNRWEVVGWRPAVSETALKMLNASGVTESKIVQLWHVRAQLQRRLDTIFSPLEVGPPVPRVTKQSGGMKKILFVPDTHHGYRWEQDHSYMHPLHDRQACDAVLEAARTLQPDEIHFHGDNLDNAESSTRWSKPLDLYATLQPSLYEFHWYLRQFRLACPSAKIVWHEGNHENRIARLLRDSAPVLENLTAVGDKYPVLHWARLLGLDALDVEYISEYPSTSWVLGKIKVHHGTVVRGGSGATTGAVARGAAFHEVFGHTHRIEVAPRTFDTPDGSQTVWVMSTGTLARIDGIVPGGEHGQANWQQGFGLAYHDETTGAVHMQAIPVLGGRCIVEGRLIEGRADRDVAAQVYNDIGQARGRAWPFVRR